jgi:thymidylate synthase (FAD)
MLISTNGTVPEDWDEDAKYGRINFLMKNRHGSPFEHNSFTFRVEAPIVVFREWHRHRIGWSYNEMSGRYTELPPDFYSPGPQRALVQQGKPGSYEFVPGDERQYQMVSHGMAASFEAAWRDYQYLLDHGIAKEVARGVLPVYTYSQMYATCNARSLMAFLSLRTKDDNSKFPSFPMYEIDVCARKMEAVFAMHMPLTHRAFEENGRVAP